MPFTHTVRGERFAFADLRELLAKANEQKSGDAARRHSRRVRSGSASRPSSPSPTCRLARSSTTRSSTPTPTTCQPPDPRRARPRRVRRDPLADGRRVPRVPPGRRTTATTLRDLHWAVTPEVAAAVAKLMGNKDLVLVAAKIRNVTRCRNTLGERGVLGIRVQPNHPADDLARHPAVGASTACSYGCGDAVIGVNPATDSVETVAAILHACWTASSRRSACRRRPAAWRTSPRSSRLWNAAPRSTCCSSRSPARRPPTPASASRSRMLRRGPRAGARIAPRGATWPGSATR